MRLVSILASVAMLSFAATSVLADPAPTAPATPPTPAAKPGKKPPSPDDMICEEDASTTGSMLTHRICKTRAQREAETAAGQDGLRNNARLVPGAGRN